MEPFVIVLALIVGLNLGISAISLIAVCKIGKGFTIQVQVQSPALQSATPLPLDQVALDRLQKELDDAAAQEQKQRQSTDDLITKINEFMIGGDFSAK